ncbi:DUF362 domain-containing protein [Maribellus maritimus]|uniref:DUF362 domain-containing protein n=1 Tax=Maribellus maritimus TaxID=2870838 RepID=UPI001EEB19F1|nr:DUF362 domain-containing protein [Maribellus maritimus]MCG6189958.1 DUF362 domain-containing protein [Maribellus maritimus]
MDKNVSSRRMFLKKLALSGGAITLAKYSSLANDLNFYHDKSPVFFTTEISNESLLNIYSKVSEAHSLSGKIAVKLHSGEPGGHHFASPSLIKNLVQSVNGTIVECNTAYQGKRFETKNHKQVIKDHGFASIAPFEILDENGSITLEVPKGKNIKDNYVGAGFAHYDSFLILSHFKGHAMAGFGGAIKNMAIGIASSKGKMWIHTAGLSKSTDDFEQCFKTEQDRFLESMAEAALSVDAALSGRLIYINLMNNLSIDCDCDSNPAPPELSDIGILASLDPVALDKACVDLILAADKEKSAGLRQRFEEKNGHYLLDYAESIGLGNQSYKMILMDD